MTKGAPRGRGGGLLAVGTIAASALLAAVGAATALAAFPYARPGANPADYTDLYLTNQVPNDICGDNNEFKYSASPDPDNTLNNVRPTEFGGIRGGRLVDRDPPADCTDPPPPGPYTASANPTAWQVTTGRPDVTISVLDSGIKWNDEDAMFDLRFKVRLNRGEVPQPQNDGLSSANEPGEDCSPAGPYTHAGYDLNGDAVFNVLDYACDARVDPDPPNGVGPHFPSWAPYAGQPMLDPQDVLIAFTDGTDADANGYVDDIVGWDFLDDDNDAFDDVQYGHGTGEAQGSSSEADNRVFNPAQPQDDRGTNVGSCPNCMVIPLRVGDSFIADDNRFAQAVTYATDNDVQVVQEALGTINNSTLARQAVNYAYRHGVTVIASAADESAQHNNWPSSLPHTIVVNSVIPNGEMPPPNQSYLAFNHCTNFNSKITLAIPSTSCSSDATGVGSGMAGIVYSAAYNAFQKGALSANPACTLTGDGPDPGSGGPDQCVITPNEVRQIMASGTIAGNPIPDDVNFASPSGGPEPSCAPVPTPGCTDPNGALWALVDANRPLTAPGRSYPARAGHDQFYGYGRVNMNETTRSIVDDPASPAPTDLPPEAELATPTWYEQVDPATATIEVRGQAFARGHPFSCRIYVAPGHYPNNAEYPTGDFRPAPAAGGACDGSDRSAAVDGKLAEIDVADLEAQFPPGTDFGGPIPPATAATGNGRPNPDPHGFVVKLVVTAADDPATPRTEPTRTGEDRRAAFLHRDQDMLAGFPKAIAPSGQVSGSANPTSDGESSPALADLDGDNRNELVFATSDGFVHALRSDGSELPGWPVRSDPPGFVSSHLQSRAYESGEVSGEVGGAIVASPAVADANHDGIPEVYATDLEGKVYGWSVGGQRIFTEESNPDYSGRPLHPFENVRFAPADPPASHFRRTQHGFIASPVLANLDGGRDLELVAAGMDRHVYVWRTNDSNPGTPGGAAPLAGFPTLVVDPAKVQSIDPQTHAVTFQPGASSDQQGAIVDTPAVGNIAGQPEPEIVVGTNEEYEEPINSGNVTTASYAPLAALLGGGNSRLYAISPAGDKDSDPMPGNAFLAGWPFKVGMMLTEVLPVVGEGITGPPVIAHADCPSGGAGPKVGVLANNGPAYVLNPDASSCYGNDPSSGRPNALETDFSPSGTTYDHPVLPALGSPAFGNLGPGVAFLSPGLGLGRAEDIAFDEYQPGQDLVGAWDTSTGQLHPGYPTAVNDLQFLTGPSVADIDGLPGEEVLAGTASKDIAAFNAAGAPANARWPKLTSDWTVANPLVGSFGTLDTNPGATKVIFSFTRSGYIDAYETDAPACSPSSWPRFHHDNANSGDMRRDAVLPGKPTGLAASGGGLSFTAPGDDLMCGRVAEYELATSDQPIDEASFDQATRLGASPATVGPGDGETIAPGDQACRFVAIRARDEQGNVGRVASVEFGGPCLPPPPPGGGQGEGEGAPSGGGHCANRIQGKRGSETLSGTPASDRLVGLAGNDRLRGRSGGDCVSGGRGRDRLSGGPGADELRGGPGADRLFGGQGADLLRGGPGHDLIRCGPGRDRAIAAARDDLRGCERGGQTGRRVGR